MEKEALEQMESEGASKKEVNLFRLADIRYLGQGYELQVPVPGGDLNQSGIAQAFDRFHEEHRQVYGYANPESELQLVNLRVTSLASMPSPSLTTDSFDKSTDSQGAFLGTRDVHFAGKAVSAKTYDRKLLIPGNLIEGPAIVEQLDSTTVIWPGQEATVDRQSNLILEDKSH